MRRVAAAVAAVLMALSVCASPSSAPRAAAPLPPRLSDAEFWKLVVEFSEPSGFFQYNIITSNESSYQDVIPELIKRVKSGGAYLGVGPEQNFTYIAALQPAIAFLVDIRRDMLWIHLMYKGIFELSPNRLEFVARLFARKPPADITPESPVHTVFQALTTAPSDLALAEKYLAEILARLKTRHGFALTPDDERGIRTMYMTFVREGVVSFWSSFRSPGYMRLMTLTDGSGKNWSFLASSDAYLRVRELQQKNLIVPLVGDLGGPKTLKATAQYLTEHGARVNAFYISNVEDYLAATWPQYARNVAALPADSSSVLIRWFVGNVTSLESIPEFLSRRK